MFPRWTWAVLPWMLVLPGCLGTLPGGTGPCEDLALHVDNTTLRPGSDTTVSVRFTNCGETPREIGGGPLVCHPGNGLVPQITWNGTLWEVRNGSAWGPLVSVCPAGLQPARELAPGDEAYVAFTWNGTFHENPCGRDVSPCGNATYTQAPPGEYTITVEVRARPDQGIWFASKTVRVSPGA